MRLGLMVGMRMGRPWVHWNSHRSSTTFLGSTAHTQTITHTLVSDIIRLKVYPGV